MEQLFVIVMLFFVSMYFIWSRTDYIPKPKDNALKNMEAYYCGWTLAQQNNLKVEADKK